VLCLAALTPIVRHTKIKGECNPYDPAWKPYLSERREAKIGATLRNRPQLLRLWKEQEGICPICNRPITKETGWDNHHMLHKAKGGNNKTENHVLVHPNCHRQVHANKGTVTKPCPIERYEQDTSGALFHA
jgi:RNA-directed DNA polymerase